MHPLERVRRATVLLTLLAVAAGAAAPPAVFAQADEVAALVRDAHAFIVAQALRPADPQVLLQRALTAVQQAVSGTDLPAAPPLTGQTAADVAAVADYIASAVRSLPAAQRDAALASALRAMIRELNDPFAAVFTPQEFRRFQAELRGERGSIGAQVDVGSLGEIVISDVTAGGPAAREAVQAGDVLEEVNGRSMLGLTPDEVLDLLHDGIGAQVMLTVRRGAGVRRLTLARALVRENATRSHLVESRIGYVRLLEFSLFSARDLARAVAFLQSRGARALVLDLRANVGGLVDEAVDAASLFLTEGPVAFEERREGTDVHTVRQSERFTGPVVVLGDGFTASSAEIVAGALQDAGAPLVGTPTYGKVSVQSVSIPPLPGDWGLRVTTARYLTRARRNIEGSGLLPNVRVPMDARFIQAPGDVQFREALTLLRARLAARTGGP